MLIWDTGEYEILPFEQKNDRKDEQMTDDERDESGDDEIGFAAASKLDGLNMSEPEKLDQAFRAGKIRLRLHGTRLPPDYTISLRLTKDKGPPALRPNPQAKATPQPSRRSSTATSNSPRRSNTPTGIDHQDPSARGTPPTDGADFDEDTFSTSAAPTAAEAAQILSAIRSLNAYPGSVNSINSIHQRWWFIALDKANCGFIRGKDADGKVTWTAKPAVTRRSYPFYVRGRDVETSVVTGRKAVDVLSDEGVVGFVPRGGWRAVLF